MLLEASEIQKLLSPNFKVMSEELKEWSCAEYERYNRYPEQLIHHSVSGNFLRSKSEEMIDTQLYINEIPFRYECALQLGETTIYPDFTIMHPETEQIYYWEHFGKMDDPEYQKNAFDKIQLYTKNGIQPHIRLIITTETATNPLSIHTIECRIQEFFPLEHANPA
jgi:hypothetical protein